jgi:hypothetical protein
MSPRSVLIGARRLIGERQVESYQTPEVKEFVLTKFKGAVLPSW